MNSVEFLQVVETFTAEDNYTVWKDLLSNLHELGKLLQYTKAYSHFNNFVVRLLQPTFLRLGWDSKAGEGMCQERRQTSTPYRQTRSYRLFQQTAQHIKQIKS